MDNEKKFSEFKKDTVVFQNISKSIAIFKDKNKFIVISDVNKNTWSPTDFSNGDIHMGDGENKFWQKFIFTNIKQAYKKVIKEIKLKYDDINPHIPNIMRLTAMLN